MTLARKQICLAILMALLIGHFGMAVHATTHSLGDAGECELCLSYNNASEALAAFPEHGVAPLKDAVVCAVVREVSVKRGWSPFLQRDPPESI